MLIKVLCVNKIMINFFYKGFLECSTYQVMIIDIYMVYDDGSLNKIIIHDI